ncbi:MAG: histidinol phosphate phosphatase domain-containing protein [Anaerolineae bacterium]|jgi:putative hydrolase|nr:histidinol phosphate phosphatase domain-containing protein [Chloroflexota bacterium]
MENNQRIEFHSHTVFSDGELIPSELIRRAVVSGHRALAITDHADASNIDELVARLVRLRQEQRASLGLQLLVGVELTHVGPADIAKLARRARMLGADIVLVHGETIVEPVAPGTNAAAIASPDVDVLAHPGMLTLQEAEDAAARGCIIEISSRRGHGMANGHVARICERAGTLMVVNTDTHAPGDLIDMTSAQLIARAAGLGEDQVMAATVTTPAVLLERILARQARRQRA